MPLFSSFKQERGGVNFSFKLNKITIFMPMTPVPRVSVHLFMGANKYKKNTPFDHKQKPRLSNVAESLIKSVTHHITIELHVKRSSQIIHALFLKCPASLLMFQLITPKGHAFSKHFHCVQVIKQLIATTVKLFTLKSNSQG